MNIGIVFIQVSISKYNKYIYSPTELKFIPWRPYAEYLPQSLRRQTDKVPAPSAQGAVQTSPRV